MEHTSVLSVKRSTIADSLIMQPSSSFLSVLKNPGFLNLWINQIFVQLSYNSLNFALIIWVFKLTQSTTAVSTLLFSIYLPAVIFGLFAGVLVDITDRKNIILIIDLLLAVLFFALIPFKSSYFAILIIAFLINSLSQFYTPAESSAIPIVAKRNQLLAANSIFSTTLYISFLLGFGLAGPLIDKFQIDFVFGLGGVLLSIATILALFFPSIVNKSDELGNQLKKAISEKKFQIIFHIGFQEIRETLHLVRSKMSVLFCILIMAGVQVVIGILAVLIPSFFEKVLHIQATNASYILVMPLGVGMVLGGFLLAKVGNRFARRTVVARGILMAGLLFFLVGIAPIISPAIRYVNSHNFLVTRPLPFTYQPPLSMILAIGAFLLGIAMVSIIVPAQTVLQESTPEEDRGKVFSVLSAVMYGLSLLPIFFAGILADIFGALPIFIGLGGLIIILGLFGLRPDFFFEENHLSLKVREFLGEGHWKKAP